MIRVYYIKDIKIVCKDFETLTEAERFKQSLQNRCLMLA
jgi:hypothetical protein